MENAHTHDIRDRWKEGPSRRCLSLWLLLLTFISLASLIVAATAFQILWEIGHRSVKSEEQEDASFVPLHTMGDVTPDQNEALHSIRLPISPDGGTSRIYRVEAYEFNSRSNHTVLYLTLGHQFKFSAHSAILEDAGGNELVKLRFFEGKMATSEDLEKEEIFTGDDAFRTVDGHDVEERELFGHKSYSDSSSDPDVVIIVGADPYAYPMTLSAYGVNGIPWGGYYGAPLRGLASQRNMVCTTSKCFFDS